MNDSQHHQQIMEDNQTTTDYPKDLCIHQLFEAQVAHTPEAVAVVFEDQPLSYQELNQRANQLAHYLRQLGVKPEVLVGICVERSLEMIVGLLAILKAGGAYVPLDPSYPRERLAFMLDDAQVPVLLTQPRLQAVLPKHRAAVVYLDIDQQMVTQNQANPINQSTPDNLAYCIYTSGTTGKPKGVLIEHRGVVRLVKNTNYAKLTAEEIFLQLAPISFDASTFEIWGCLLNGAQLVVMPAHTPSLAELGYALQRYQVTILWLTAGLFHLMVDERLGDLTQIRQLLAGGDVLSVSQVKKVLQTLKDGVLINSYGPTENTTFTCCYTVTDANQLDNSVPIGCPIANTQVYVLDAELQPVPIGVKGELYIGGDGLARGYLNRPELTAEKFIPHPFNNPKARLYKTGDLARYQPDGNLEFLGRLDHQVKIRGFRIELEEIEAVLCVHPGVSEAVVVVREEVGDKRLVAYVVYKLTPERVPLHSTCLLGCILEVSEDNLIEVTTVDISYGGVGLAGVPGGCQLGQRLRLRLRLPEIPDNFWVEGNIAWLRSKRAGVRFELTPEQQHLLHHGINRFLETQGLLRALQNSFIEHLRKFLQESLPDYMVPSHFVILDALPLTPNGKVDRHALPQLDPTRPDLRSPEEEAIAKIWADCLGLERVGLHDHFLKLGGHSLLATRILSRLQEVFQVTLPLSSLFEAPTVAQLAKRVKELLQEKSSQTPVVPFEPVARDADILPLSFAQQQLWIQTQFVQDQPVYNEPLTLRLGGPVNVMAVEQSLNEVIRRHEALRTTFRTEHGQPVQVIAENLTLKLRFIDLGTMVSFPSPPAPLPEGEGSQASMQVFSPLPLGEGPGVRVATEEAQQPFNLAQGPLLRATLIRWDDTDYRLFLTLHHLIFDGVSLTSILLPELEKLYQAFANGQRSPLPEPYLQYADYASWQPQWLQGKLLETQLAYWKQQLANLPQLPLPTDHPRPALSTYRGARHGLALSKELTQALKALSQTEGVTLFITLLAAFNTLLYRYTGQDDIPVGTVTAGRHRAAELEEIVGYLVNPLVLRTDLSGNPSFSQLLQRVREVTLVAYKHQDLPFDHLVRELHHARQLGANPLFQVAFVLVPPMPILSSGWTISQLDIHTGTAKFDLTMELDERPEGIIGRLEYSTDLFEEATITRMISHYQTLLEGIVAYPENSLSQLPLLTAKEQQQLRLWNKTPLAMGIHQLFEAQVKRTPDASAVVFENQSLTYRELNQRANQLAHYLMSLGVKPEVLVGISVERSLEMIVGVLGVLKAGGAYVPLDPKYPQERLDFMVEDAQVKVLLTQQHLRKTFQGPYSLCCLDSDWETLAKESLENPDHEVAPHQLAYVIYTSGSTGRPKGVMVEHRGLCNLAIELIRRFNIQPDSRVLQFVSFSFDVSISEIIMALVSGATLCLVTRDALFPGRPLLQLLHEQAITIVNLPPSVLAILPVDEVLTNLQTIVVGGEPCPAELIDQWAPGRRFFNAYGPTETTVCATIAECTDGKQKPPIGRPIANTQVYVLDKQLQPVPVGVPGELYIGGIGLARGYLNRPELTEEKFIPNPFSETPGGRLYKTGDLARYLSDGNLEFLGRSDNQVKIRGFRIELGEVETILSQHPAIQQVVVMVREEIPGDKRLVAYWVANSPTPPDHTELRQWLSKKLPDYMIPTTFILLEFFPLTPNGKVDRRAISQTDLTTFEKLSNLSPDLTTFEKLSNLSPDLTTFEKLSNLECIITQIWQEVLCLNKIDLHAPFFEIGGHSLLLVQVQEKLTVALNRPVPITVLLQSPTIHTLANYFSQSSAPESTRFDSTVARTKQQRVARLKRMNNE